MSLWSWDKEGENMMTDDTGRLTELSWEEKSRGIILYFKVKVKKWSDKKRVRSRPPWKADAVWSLEFLAMRNAPCGVLRLCLCTSPWVLWLLFFSRHESECIPVVSLRAWTHRRGQTCRCNITTLDVMAALPVSETDLNTNLTAWNIGVEPCLNAVFCNSSCAVSYSH